MLEVTNKTNTKIKYAYLFGVVESFFDYFSVEEKTVSVVFVGDRLIRKLNKIYRHKDKITDILSFEGDDDLLGELIIDYAQIKRQAKRFNNTVKQELVFILVHGLLHLIGYNDDTEKGRVEMEQLGEKFIATL